MDFKEAAWTSVAPGGAATASVTHMKQSETEAQKSTENHSGPHVRKRETEDRHFKTSRSPATESLGVTVHLGQNSSKPSWHPNTNSIGGIHQDEPDTPILPSFGYYYSHTNA